jgi:RNA polymerase sigma-70 factor (ECF subfamily)
MIYLVFNEGYSQTDPEAEACAFADEAIRLARLLLHIFPAEPEIMGLLALMLLQISRRPARFDAAGAIVLLEDQDRSLWNRPFINEALALLDKAIRHHRPGPYQIQAAIAALHDEAPSWAATDWPQIAGLYRRLFAIDPSPVIELNLAAAVAMADGPAVGLAMMDGLAAAGALDSYPYLHAARADLLRRLGRRSESAAAYRRALELTDNRAEQAFLQGRLDDLANGREEGPPRLS